MNLRAITVTLAAAGLLVSATPALADAVAFRSAPDLSFQTNSAPGAVAVGDFNSDGKQDLAITDFSKDCVYVRLGQGDGTFSGEGKIDGLFRPFDVAVGDFDGDGTEDLVVAAGVSPNHSIAVLRGIGDGTFMPTAALDVPGSSVVRSVAVGDFNGDGREDLAAASFSYVSVRLGNGNGTFSGGVDVAFDPEPASVATGDFNGDGAEDLAVIADAPPARVAILPGNGNGTFAPIKTVGLPNGGEKLAIGDFNGDGREDVVATIRAEDKVSVRLGNGAGMLGDGPPDVPVGDQPFGIVVGDFDSDGKEDLATTNLGAGVSVRLGNGDGTFKDGGEVAVGAGPIAAALGDFDGDGTEDLAAANYQGGTASIRLGAGMPALAGNLLVNGGFEQGLGARRPTQSPMIPGWTTTGGMTFGRYGAIPHFGVPSWLQSPRYMTGGLNLLWGGYSGATGGITTATQTVDVSAQATAIDAGQATANLSAYLGGGLFYGDRISVRADFVDASGGTLGSFDIGPVTAAERFNITTLLLRAGSAPVPASTRGVRVTLTSIDDDKSYSSAIADNVKLTLDIQPPVAVTGGGGPGGLPGTSTAGGAFGAHTRVTLRLATKRLAVKGPLKVRISNGNAFTVTCVVHARIGGATLKSATLALGAKVTRVVSLTLPRHLRLELRHRRVVTVSLIAVVRDRAGNARKARIQTRLRLRM